MSILQDAREGKLRDEFRQAAKGEPLSAEEIMRGVAGGTIAVPANPRRRATELVGIGQGLKTKVNANIGTSHDYADLETEKAKLQAAIRAKTDTIMDLSTGGDIRDVRNKLMDECPVTVGTVPIYEAAIKALREGGAILKMTASGILDAVRQHCEDGVDFVTLHCGVTQQIVKRMLDRPRHCGMVSRGGTFIAHWMLDHRQENPLYERYAEVLDILREFEVTVSLGDGMRPGSLEDAFDGPQVEELMAIAELAERARNAGVQVIVEGPGHVPLDQVEAQVKLQKQLCHGAPFYVLGPLVTDIAPGYDHITSAIGGALAGAAGADYLCYVTASEHLALPGPEEVYEGVIATRIAAHAADIAKGIPGAREWDREFSAMRRRRDWEGQIEHCIDPKKARELRSQHRPSDEKACSMCGDYCVFKLLDEDAL